MKYEVTLNGKVYEVDVTELDEAIVQSVSDAPASQPQAQSPAPTAQAQPAAKPVSGKGTAVKAPMPGTILKTNISIGQTVKEGDVLFILEAMKMENEIPSPVSGTVTSLAADKGSSVATDDVLAYIG